MCGDALSRLFSMEPGVFPNKRSVGRDLRVIFLNKERGTNCTRELCPSVFGHISRSECLPQKHEQNIHVAVVPAGLLLYLAARGAAPRFGLWAF